MKWTKKEIASLRSAIASFWLLNRPLSDSARERTQALEAVRARLVEHRAEIACAGVAQLVGIAADRERKDLELVEHLKDHPAVYGKSTDEVIARFHGFAERERKSVRWGEALIAKVREHGLPPEVQDFDPTAA